MCLDWESNQRPFGLQASAQSAEPYQPGPAYAFSHSPLASQVPELIDNNNNNNNNNNKNNKNLLSDYCVPGTLL